MAENDAGMGRVVYVNKRQTESANTGVTSRGRLLLWATATVFLRARIPGLCRPAARGCGPRHHKRSVITGTGAVLDDGSVVVADGRITSIVTGGTEVHSEREKMRPV